MPRRFQSIRFRLSLAFALVVFSVGVILVGGIYLYEVNQLDRPVLMTRPLVVRDPNTGEVMETNAQAVLQSDFQRAVVESLEQTAYREALDELRRASFGALGILFIVSFGTGYILSGWTLRPVERITGVARDISATDLSRRIDMAGPDDELKALADTFDAMLDRLQSSFEDQRRFVHEASHELRNPLAIARTNLEVALDGGSTEELESAAEIAHRATGRMSLLVEDLLEQARHGIPELKRTAIDVNKLAVDAAAEYQAQASGRRLTIEAIPSPNEAIVHGDGPALRRALSNLVANATRLAPTGSTITIRVESEADCLLLSVSDEGPGVPLADHERIFERFQRGTDPGAGSGLGLSIVKRVVERHGGSLALDSDLGRGSTFTLRLPVPIDRGEKQRVSVV